MPRGGRRSNAGRKPKALAEKLLDGNPGKRQITVNKFKDKEKNKKSNAPATRHDCIDTAAVAGMSGALPEPGDIHSYISDFVQSSGCGHLIAGFLLEDFAFLRRAYLECEYVNKENGRTVDEKRSPYVGMALDYHKEMMSVYNQIWNIISKNSEVNYESKNSFFEMLTNRGF